MQLRRRVPTVSHWTLAIASVLGIVFGLDPVLDQRVSAQDVPSELAQYYGFRPLEIFKLQHRSSNMIAGDLNSDGLTDLALIDNSNSRIDILQQRKKQPEPPEKVTSRDANSFKGDWRFEHKKLPVDKALAAMCLGDFNGDGRTDIAYLGLPDRIITRLQSETGEWKSGQSFRLPDLQALSMWMMASGDLNHDGKDDLAVLGKNETFILHQKNGELQRSETVLNTSEKLALLQVGDLDGDGRVDCSYLANDDIGRALCVRLQSPAGRLGPEFRFDLDKPRATTLRNVDGQPGLEILSIHGQTGRLRVLQIRKPETKTGELAGQLVQYGFGQQASSRDRDLAVSDINGDGLTDVVVTDPEASQILIFQQVPGAGLNQGTPFPSLTGATSVQVGDFLQDKIADVVVMSPKEKAIGVSHMAEGRMTFPQPIPTDKDPVLFTLSDIDQDKSPEVIYIARDRSTTKTNYVLKAVKAARSADQLEWQPSPLSLVLNLKGDPEKLIPFDVDSDGRMDFLVPQGTERPVMLLKADGKGGFLEIVSEGGIGLGSVTASSLFAGVLDSKSALLVAQNNFVRNLQLNEKNQWRVMDQFSASETTAKISGSATLNLDGQPGNEIVLIDTGVKKLRVLRKEMTGYLPWREVEMGPFPYRGTYIADLNGDGLDDLLLFGGGKFGVLYANQTDPKLLELGTYESSIEDGYLSDVVAGDLNHDGRSDLVLIETKTHQIEIVDYSKELGLRTGLAFKILESKGIAEREESQSEPRESLVVDVTGDGLDDLIFLAHDRVLVYPQDDGK